MTPQVDPADLAHVRAALAGVMKPTVIESWLEGPNDSLGARPIDVLAIRGVGPVLDAAQVAVQKAWG